MSDKEEIDRRGIILASLGCLGLVGALATLGVVTDGGGTTDDTLTESELVDAGSSTFDATAGMCGVDLLVDVAPSERVVVQNAVAGDSDRTVENTGERVFTTFVPSDSEVLIYAVDLDGGTSGVLERLHVGEDCSLSEGSFE